ncbi:hypothetical protein [Armatimonas sp.]|uniref:hypothetical protein n=1 Tax=Armatimonas sp. TaxID=1872638 RepID=UPI00286CBE1C|nr:hypothetical protein [Armatimonas sp.]
MNMFSPNPYTRRRQQKAAAVFVVSGVIAAVGISKALRVPAPESPLMIEVISTSWKVRFTANNLIVVSSQRTGQQQALLVPLRNPKIEKITGLAVSGNEVTVHLQKISGTGPLGYIVRDCTQTWDARTGILKTQRFE